MKDYTIHLDNENKTKITFAYEHGLPFKHNIRPTIKYGLWEEDKSKMLMKIYFDDEDIGLFDNKLEITGSKSYNLKNEYWIDLNDAYLIIPKTDDIVKKFKENNIIVAFFHNNNFLNALDF